MQVFHTCCLSYLFNNFLMFSLSLLGSIEKSYTILFSSHYLAVVIQFYALLKPLLHSSDDYSIWIYMYLSPWSCGWSDASMYILSHTIPVAQPDMWHRSPATCRSRVLSSVTSLLCAEGDVTETLDILPIPLRPRHSPLAFCAYIRRGGSCLQITHSRQPFLCCFSDLICPFRHGNIFCVCVRPGGLWLHGTHQTDIFV